MSVPHTPLIPAQAGIQGHVEMLVCFALDPRLRGDERMRGRT